ncbi:helix-turn-helix, araC type [Streptomyces laurentii]|uniref:Helix-turn-helix, araC type n=1 Tax=Streptomyces laurentii TaxID=39478 RepID=A0A160P3M9_STRLU|nr:helix-turn-helix, araC type [Streptomyces laurentii]
MESMSHRSDQRPAPRGPDDRNETDHDDLLSELLTPLRLTGVLDSRWRAAAPWAIEGDATRDCAVLHYVVEGDCWITGTGRPPLRLGAGDLVVLPTGAAHRLADHPGSRAEPVKALRPGQRSEQRSGYVPGQRTTRRTGPDGTGQGQGAVPAQAQAQAQSRSQPQAQGPRPRRETVQRAARRAVRGPGEIRIGGTGAETRLLSAGLPYDAGATTDLYRSLPGVLVLDRSQVAREPLLRDTLLLLACATRPVGPGDRLITLRAFEMALVLALRPLLCDLAADPEHPVYPALLRNPGIRRALVLIATRFAEPWTLDVLAREAGMSRSAFTAAFRDLVGVSPARHLTACRMREAARLLTETSLPQSALPARVGYQSAVGFHLAFRKWYGTTPGVYRADDGAHGH